MTRNPLEGCDGPLKRANSLERLELDRILELARFRNLELLNHLQRASARHRVPFALEMLARVSSRWQVE